MHELSLGELKLKPATAASAFAGPLWANGDVSSLLLSSLIQAISS